MLGDVGGENSSVVEFWWKVQVGMKGKATTPLKLTCGNLKPSF
jgi:hypothetical protein